MTEPEPTPTPVVVHPELFAAFWDDRLPGHTGIRRVIDGVRDSRLRLVTPDATRFLALRTLALSIGRLDPGTAQLLADDVGRLIESLLVAGALQFVATEAVVLNGFLLAAEYGIALEDAICLHVAAARGHELYLPWSPEAEVVELIRSTYPGFRFRVVE